MYVSSPNSEDSSFFTMDSDKLLNAIVETFKAHKDHLTSKTYKHNTTSTSNSSEESEVVWN